MNEALPPVEIARGCFLGGLSLIVFFVSLWRRSDGGGLGSGSMVFPSVIINTVIFTALSAVFWYILSAPESRATDFRDLIDTKQEAQSSKPHPE